MSNHSLQEIAAEILKRDGFTLIGHMIPDGDCIGSLLGLYMALQNAGKQCNILLRDTIPANYTFLSGSDCIRQIEALDTVYQNLIFLDCSDAERSGQEVLDCIHGKPQFIINIDHHKTNEQFGDMNYVEDCAATGEILAELIPELKQPITPEIANALYTAIIMDTGNFQYSSTTSKTFRTAANLLECGADLGLIRISMFESRDMRELQLLAITLSHMQLTSDQQIAWMYLTLEEARSIHAEDFHPEGMINNLRSIAGIEVAVYFREMENNLVKMAFRSKNTTDVSQIAGFFGGGGHHQAAGANFAGTLSEAIATVIPYIKEKLGAS